MWFCIFIFLRNPPSCFLLLQIYRRRWVSLCVWSSSSALTKHIYVVCFFYTQNALPSKQCDAECWAFLNLTQKIICLVFQRASLSPANPKLLFWWTEELKYSLRLIKKQLFYVLNNCYVNPKINSMFLNIIRPHILLWELWYIKAFLTNSHHSHCPFTQFCKFYVCFSCFEIYFYTKELKTKLWEWFSMNQI